MRSTVWRVTLVLACVAVVSLVAADADAARRSALAGNKLIRDFDDTFAFPHLAIKYNHELRIDYAPYDGFFDGSGTLIFGGDTSAWNVNTGRVHYGDGLPQWAWGGTDEGMYMFGGGVLPALIPDWAPDTAEWLDIGYAWGGASPMGLTVGIVGNTTKTEPNDDPLGPGQLDESLSFFDINYGVDLSGTDLGVSIGFGSASDKGTEILPNETADSSILQIAASARGAAAAGSPYYDWGWLLDFVYASVSDAVLKGSSNPSKESSTCIAVQGSWGPTFVDPGGMWTAAGYLTIDYQSYNNLGGSDPFDGVVTKTSEFTLPGWNLAGEFSPASWFAVRGGIRSGYAIVTVTQEDPDADPTEGKLKTRQFDAEWTAGVGLRKGDSFGLDMTLNPDLLHSGYLPGGADNDDDVFGLITMWIKWGKTDAWSKN